ncbi:MAG: hypothetical protein JSV86_04915 [Gemmatimonadota bacterium]|nr:MAG: hypothetical protein JSV86_04915 [Gemmatimonadota bacterium]
MAITVGDYRQFLSDSAQSMADAQAGRILDRTMGAAMRRLSREAEWTWKRKRAILFLEPRKQSTNATLTQRSNLVTLDQNEPDAFPLEQRYYDDKWNIQLGGRETIYKFAEPPLPYSLTLESVYAGPSTTGGTFDTLNLTRSRYPLPERFEHVFGLELPQEGVRALSYLSRSDFEVYRRGLLTSASQPWVYTTYGDEELEIWPPAAEDRGYEAEVDYQVKLRVPKIDALDAEELDWPDSHEDLLWAVGRLQLAIELGADAVQFDVQGVAQEYARMLAEYKSDDQSRGKRVWSMDTPDRTIGTPRPFGLNLRGPVRGEG